MCKVDKMTHHMGIPVLQGIPDICLMGERTWNGKRSGRPGEPERGERHFSIEGINGKCN